MGNVPVDGGGAIHLTYDDYAESAKSGKDEDDYMRTICSIGGTTRVQPPPLPYEVQSPGGVGLPRPSLVPVAGEVVHSARLTNRGGRVGNHAPELVLFSQSRKTSVLSQQEGAPTNHIQIQGEHIDNDNTGEDEDYIRTHGANLAAQPTRLPYEVQSPGGIGIPRPAVIPVGGEVVQVEKLRASDTRRPAAVVKLSNGGRRRPPPVPQVGRTVVLEDQFGVAMPGKKSETNAWLVCSTTDEIASGTLEVHENKSDIMNVPKLTMRVKNNNRIEKTKVGNRFCLILEDAANHGKPLVVFMAPGSP